MQQYDVVVIGAGAAGMMAGIEAGRRGRRVIVFDHARQPGEKIRISGGGHCNFTNLFAAPERFLSQNPRFAISALTRYTPADFLQLVESYGIAWHEKTLGQLFCDGSSRQIVNLLTSELAKAGASLHLETRLQELTRTDSGFRLRLSSGEVAAQAVIVASGGKSIPKIGATGLAYDLARQFGLNVVATRPGLVPLTFEPGMLARLAPLAGVATEVVASTGRQSFREAMLFTHRGLSGPVILQISSYWREGEPLHIDLLPDRNAMAFLQDARRSGPKAVLSTVLARHLPKRLAQAKAEEIGLNGQIGDFSDEKLAGAAAALQAWRLKPTGTEGYRTAEVTLGGVDTAELSSTTMAARRVPGLYFVGEAVDVTGWLGGYNFQWAWASGWAAGQVA